jgi:hypothetical protein
VIVNNSTNINKTNNHLSTQLIEYKKENDMMMEIQIVTWARHKNVPVLNQLMGYLGIYNNVMIK